MSRSSLARTGWLLFGVTLALPAAAQSACSTFDARVVDAGTTPRGLVVGDVDGDGDLDALVADYDVALPSASALRVLTNDGAGNFVRTATIAVTPSLAGLAGGDLNGDGLVDLVATAYQTPLSGSGLLVYSNHGGGFGAPTLLPGYFGFDRAAALGDLDGDGDLDLAAARAYDGVAYTGISVYVNDGTGHFAAPLLIPLAERADCVAIGDFDGDGDADVTAGQFGLPGKLFTFANQGGLAFTLASSPVVGQTLRQILALDLDGDLVRDRVVLDVNPRNLIVVRASGTATVHLPAFGAAAIGAGDVDGDGDPDVLVTDAGLGGTFKPGVQILRNVSGVLALNGRIPVGAGALAFVSADVDQDGALDVLTADVDSGSLSVRRNAGSGLFESFSAVPTLAYGASLGFVDLDLDGDLDAFGVAGFSENLGGGSWALGAPLASPPTNGAIAAVDLDGNGLPELVVTNGTFPTIHVYYNAGGLVFSAPFSQASAVAAVALAAGDVDGDGDQDLVLGTNAGASVALLRNADGHGTFAAPVLLATGTGRHSLALVDVELDGDLDLVCANKGSNSLVVLANDGAGNFGAPATIAAYTGQGPVALAARDLDLDGDLDLAIASETSRSVEVLLGGGGTFAAHATLALGRPPKFLAFGRFDGDGASDLVVFDGSLANPSYAGRGSVWLQHGDAQFELEGFHTYGSTVLGLATGDLDGDGYDEFVVGAGPNDVYANHATCSPAVAYCFGDGSGSACPCGNLGAPGHGCDNSIASGGGLLAARGVAHVAHDTLVLDASGVPATATTLFFQGTLRENGGLGVFSGDGLLCTGGGLIRLGARAASGGARSFGFGVAGDPAISVRGAVPAAGATRTYQVWYRNAAAFCTSATFNLTNALSVAWGS